MNVKIDILLLNVKKLLIAMLLLCVVQHSKAQDIDGVHSFFVGGVSMDIPNNHRLLLYTGVSPTDNVKAFLALPNFKVNKYLTLTPGYTYVNVKPDEATTIVENHIMAMATISVPIAEKWTFVNRNMYFHRIRKDVEDLSFYRNRLGVYHYITLFKKATNLYAHNEIFLNLNNGQISRNRVILGGEIKLLKWLSPQVMYMFQSDKGIGSRHLGWLVLTVPLENFGLFKKHATDAQIKD